MPFDNYRTFQRVLLYLLIYFVNFVLNPYMDVINVLLWQMNFDLLPQCQGLYHWSLTAHPRGGEMRITCIINDNEMKSNKHRLWI